MRYSIDSYLDKYHVDRAVCSRELKALLKHDPTRFQSAVLERVRGGDEGPAIGYALWLLHQHHMLVDLLIDTSMPTKEAVRVALVAAPSVLNLDLQLANVLKTGDGHEAVRVLVILRDIPITTRILPVLTAVLPVAGPEIRSRIALLYGRICQNTLFTSRLGQDPDPRVRANMMEALWGSKHPFARRAFQTALRDTDNRVIANAAMGLYRLGEPEGLETLHGLAKHVMGAYRASAAWAMGETSDPRCEPVLERLLEDPNTAIRRVASEALVKVRASMTRAASAGALDVRLLSAGDPPGGWKRLVVSVVDQNGRPIKDLPASAFTILEDADPVTDVRFKPPGDRERLALAYVLDCCIPLLSDWIDQTATALIKSLHGMKSGDRCVICKYADGVEAPQGFSIDPVQLRSAIVKPYSGPVARPRLFDAVNIAIDFVLMQRGVRSAIVVSDGTDAGSEMPLDQLVEAACRTGVPIHAIAYGDPAGHDTLRRLTSETGGRMLSIVSVEEFGEACRQIFGELSSVYTMTYKPTRVPRQLEVKVQSPQGCGGDVRTSHPLQVPQEGEVEVSAV